MVKISGLHPLDPSSILGAGNMKVIRKAGIAKAKREGYTVIDVTSQALLPPWLLCSPRHARGCFPFCGRNMARPQSV